MTAAVDLVSARDVDFISPEKTFGFRLWHVLHAWQRRVDAALAGLDLTHMQFVVLALTYWLEHTGESPTQSRIAAYGQIDRMTLSKVLRLLEDKGYVLRRPHPSDPRANLVSLTEIGRATALQAKQLVVRMQDGFFGRLTAEGQVALGVQLDALLALERCAPAPCGKTVSGKSKVRG